MPDATTQPPVFHLYSVARDGAACGAFDPAINPAGAHLVHINSAMDPEIFTITCPECVAIVNADLMRS